jgi:hypothetical protein
MIKLCPVMSKFVVFPEYYLIPQHAELQEVACYGEGCAAWKKTDGREMVGFCTMINNVVPK